MENENISVRVVEQFSLNSSECRFQTQICIVMIFRSLGVVNREHLVHCLSLFFSDFLLYISPIYVALYLPDLLAMHFLHYYVFIRTLHYFRTADELIDIEHFIIYYQKHLSKHYGEKSQLLSVHLHSHLKEQVLRHGSLLFSSCFPRESYLGHCLKWCHGSKYILEQFITWYSVNKSLSSKTTYDLDRIFHFEKLDNRFINDLIIQNYKDRLSMCLDKKKIQYDSIQYFSRYYRGLSVFHSIAYIRGGSAISFRVSIMNEYCPMKRNFCFGEVIFYFEIHEGNYAFVKLFYCIDCCISQALPTVKVPDKLKEKLGYFYGFYHHRQYRYKIIPVLHISNKAISMPWDDNVSAYTDVFFDLEHD